MAILRLCARGRTLATMATRMTYGDAALLIDDNEVTAVTPATAKGFADLVILAAHAENRWRVDVKGLADGA